MLIGARERVALTGGPFDGEHREVYTNTENLIIMNDNVKLSYFRSKEDPQVFMYVGELGE